MFKYDLILSSSNAIEMTYKFEETEKLSIYAFFIKKKKVFARHSDFLILTSVKPDGVNLWYFKHRFFLSNRVHSLKYLRFTTLGSKDIGIRNISLWTTQFL